MDGGESHITNPSVLTTSTGQPLTQPSSVSKSSRINMPTTQNIVLIWLDNKLDDTSSDYQNSITNLRSIVNAVNVFADGDECIHSIESIADEKICMIISGSMAQHFVPRVHDLSQVDSIFILCKYPKYKTAWIKYWPKIKGVYSETQWMHDDLRETRQQCEQNSVSISVMNTGGSLDNPNLNQLDPHFVYTQIMGEIVCNIHFKPWHINKFIEYCRKAICGDENALKDIDQIAQKYHEHSPIWWYTHECFLNPMLNRAFRTINFELMIKMGFFIRDLHCQIEQLYRKQTNDHGSYQRVIVYRGQGIETKMFQKIAANKGGLLSFNCFLFTDTNYQVSLKLAKRALSNTDMMGVVFVMIIDTARSNTPFASVAGIQHFESQENQMLLSMHTVFRIGEIKPHADDCRLFQIELIVANEKDNDLRQLIDRIRQETCPNSQRLHRFGSLLNEMNQPVRIRQLYEIFLKLAIKENFKAPVYAQLDMITQELRKHEETISRSEGSTEAEERQTSFCLQILAASYNNIGHIYFDMSDYLRALFSYKKALQIQQQFLPSTDPNLAMTINHIGNAYFYMNKLPRALSFKEKALAIQQISLPFMHSDLTVSYDNIGNIHFRMGDYPKALSFHEKVLGMHLQSLSPDHPLVAASYNNIGASYYGMKDYSKALEFYEKTLSIRKKTLSSTHVDLSMSYSNIGHVYFHMDDYPKALFYYEKALKIQQETLPPTHSDLAMSFNNIADVYARMNSHATAVSYKKMARTIQQQSSSAHDRNRVTSETNIVLSSVERPSHRAKRSLPSRHEKSRKKKTLTSPMQ